MHIAQKHQRTQRLLLHQEKYQDGRITLTEKVAGRRQKLYGARPRDNEMEVNYAKFQLNGSQLTETS
jgi:hypothetical protein